MNLKKFDSLVDLYFHQAEKQNPKKIFLEWLNPKNKTKFTWQETSLNIYKLAKIIKENIKDGDRCLLVSENRPEWLISDIAIMLANGITVPAYTTYTEIDYKYLIEDCEPSVIILSNSIIHNKVKNLNLNSLQNTLNSKILINLEQIKKILEENLLTNFDYKFGKIKTN